MCGHFVPPPGSLGVKEWLNQEKEEKTMEECKSAISEEGNSEISQKLYLIINLKISKEKQTRMETVQGNPRS